MNGGQQLLSQKKFNNRCLMLQVQAGSRFKLWPWVCHSECSSSKTVQTRYLVKSMGSVRALNQWGTRAVVGGGSAWEGWGRSQGRGGAHPRSSQPKQGDRARISAFIRDNSLLTLDGAESSHRLFMYVGYSWVEPNCGMFCPIICW